MIFRMQQAFPRFRLTGRLAWPDALRGRGRHKADSLAGADWHERTPRPEPSPARLSAPRVVAARLPLAERVRLAYDAAERQMTARLDAAVAQSRLNWSKSHA